MSPLRVAEQLSPPWRDDGPPVLFRLRAQPSRSSSTRDLALIDRWLERALPANSADRVLGIRRGAEIYRTGTYSPR
jgi:hypothetical protein